MYRHCELCAYMYFIHCSPYKMCTLYIEVCISVLFHRQGSGTNLCMGPLEFHYDWLKLVFVYLPAGSALMNLKKRTKYIKTID